MGWVRLSMLLVGIALLTGCTKGNQSGSRASDDSAVPYLSAAELHAALADRTRPVLVEFCVPYGCARCETMRSQVNQLAQDKSNGIEILRVDFTLDRALANQMGVTVCPSYIALEGGEELFRISYPTSGALIATELDRLRADATQVDQPN